MKNVVSACKKKRIAFLFCILAILIFISGCQQKNDEGKWLLTGDQLSAMESLYGQDRAETVNAFHLGEGDISQSTEPGCWDLTETVSIAGKDFSESLLFEVSTETFYGAMFSNVFEGSEEFPNYVENILGKLNDAYGEPSTYPGLLNRLTDENFSSDFLEAVNSGTMSNWREEWDVGEKTKCELVVYVAENHVRVVLEYIIAVERPR